MNWRLPALVLAVLATAATFLRPGFDLPRDVYRYLFVIDITQSMLARDYPGGDGPPQRLERTRAAIREVLHALPCGSEAGLALFTTQSVNLLFEPLEICEHFPAIDDALTHSDWRMAWSANSHVAQGLFAAIREVARRDPGVRLAFFTDGQETPPLSFRPQFNGKPGVVRGYLLGTGGTRPVTVPRYDREGRPLGVWENRDIEPPPITSTDYSEKIEVKTLPREGPYLSWVDESHLKELAATTGLGYRRLEDPADLARVLLTPELAERRTAKADVRPLLGLAALVLLLLIDGLELLPRRRPRP